ncbi:MAG TPA: TadE family protein [Candidatus Acidoferrales bacterium]|nr:TadE family protein [Candidatus Acidoferrales bacterium]
MRNPQRGQALIEFALILPVFLLLMLGGADLIMAFSAAQNVEYVAEETARCVAVGTNPNCPLSTAQAYAQTLALGVGLPNPQTIILVPPPPNGCPNPLPVVVTVNYPFTPVFPVFSFPKSISLVRQAQFTCP